MSHVEPTWSIYPEAGISTWTFSS